MTALPNQEIDVFWSGLYDQGRDYTLIRSQEISNFLQYADPASPNTALDVGCGTGQLTRELWHRGYKVAGVDISESAIKIAQSLTVVPATELYYKRADIEQDAVADLPFQPYGLITCKLVYAFMRDKPAFLDNVVQLLDSKGVLVVITPLLETTPPEKKGIAASQEDVDLLRGRCDQIAWYEERELGYFVGCHKA